MSLRLRKCDDRPSHTRNRKNGMHFKLTPLFFSSTHATIRTGLTLLLLMFISTAFISLFSFQDEQGITWIAKQKTLWKTSKTIPRSSNMFNIDKRLIRHKCQDVSISLQFYPN